MRLYAVDGHWYLGVTINGHTYLICYKGKVGDCIRI